MSIRSLGEGQRWMGSFEDAHNDPHQFTLYSHTATEKMPRQRTSCQRTSRRFSFSGVAKQAQVYPPGLCDAICQGLKDQIEMGKSGRLLLATVSFGDEDVNHQSVIVRGAGAKIGPTV